MMLMLLMLLMLMMLMVTIIWYGDNVPRGIEPGQNCL
jgi:hypothetical protein